MLASIAITYLLSKQANPRPLGLILFALAIGELVQAPLVLRDRARALPDSPAYKLLTQLPKAPLAEFPFWATSRNQ